MFKQSGATCYVCVLEWFCNYELLLCVDSPGEVVEETAVWKGCFYVDSIMLELQSRSKKEEENGFTAI